MDHRLGLHYPLRRKPLSGKGAMTPLTKCETSTAFCHHINNQVRLLYHHLYLDLTLSISGPSSLLTLILIGRTDSFTSITYRYTYSIIPAFLPSTIASAASIPIVPQRSASTTRSWKPAIQIQPLYIKIASRQVTWRKCSQ